MGKLATAKTAESFSAKAAFTIGRGDPPPPKPRMELPAGPIVVKSGESFPPLSGKNNSSRVIALELEMTSLRGKIRQMEGIKAARQRLEAERDKLAE